MKKKKSSFYIKKRIINLEVTSKAIEELHQAYNNQFFRQFPRESTSTLHLVLSQVIKSIKFQHSYYYTWRKSRKKIGQGSIKAKLFRIQILLYNVHFLEPHR